MFELQGIGAGTVHLMATGMAWFADVEAQGSEHLRVRLRPPMQGAMPTWAVGTTLQCAMDADDGRYSTEAVVLKQVGAYLWLRVAMTWARGERRQHKRAVGGFPVRYRARGIDGLGVCQDLSVGGMRLRVARALPVQTRVQLHCNLPGESAALRLEGLVMRVVPVEDMETGWEMGLKFVGLSLADSARLARYLQTAQDA